MSTDLQDYRTKIIHHDCDHADLVNLEQHFKMMRDHDLENLISMLGLTPGSDWRECVDQVMHLTWGEVMDAYGRATGHDF